MKSFKFLMFILLFWGSVGYSQEVPVEVTLHRSNNLGIAQADHFILHKKYVEYNLARLTKAEALALAEQIKNHKSSSAKNTCTAGRYTLTVKSGKMEHNEKGCAEGAEYAELLVKLQKLAKLTKQGRAK